MPKVGAHVSAAISLEKSFEKALEIGADCTQIFISPPQQWFQTKHNQEEIERYIKKAKETGIGPNFIHGTYLVNLGTDRLEHLQKSIDWLIYALNLAAKLGIEGVIFHPGSHKGTGFDQILPQLTASLKTVLDSQEKRKQEIDHDGHPVPLLILEASAGQGDSIGRNFTELGQILKQTYPKNNRGVKNNRLKICLDTQHIFAAGYDLRYKLTIDKTLEEFDQEIGLENLAAIHANDSKTDYRSAKDRHENIGTGLIGEEGFRSLINHPKLQNVPFILEVPGFSNNGPDTENILKLKSLIDQV